MEYLANELSSMHMLQSESGDVRLLQRCAPERRR